jgi:hypothetical protein
MIVSVNAAPGEVGRLVGPQGPETDGNGQWACTEFLSDRNWSTIVAQRFGGTIGVDREVRGLGTEAYMTSRLPELRNDTL